MTKDNYLTDIDQILELTADEATWIKRLGVKPKFSSDEWLTVVADEGDLEDLGQTLEIYAHLGYVVGPDGSRAIVTALRKPKRRGRPPFGTIVKLRYGLQLLKAQNIATAAGKSREDALADKSEKFGFNLEQGREYVRFAKKMIKEGKVQVKSLN